MHNKLFQFPFLIIYVNSLHLNHPNLTPWFSDHLIDVYGVFFIVNKYVCPCV